MKRIFLRKLDAGYARMAEQRAKSRKSSTFLTFLENFRIIEGTYKSLRQTFYEGSLECLTKIQDLPRVFILAQEVGQELKKITMDTLIKFLKNRQAKLPPSEKFTLGELLWFPAMLKLYYMEVLGAECTKSGSEAADIETASRCYANLVYLRSINWSQSYIAERLYFVDEILNADPGNVYSRCDATTKGTYRAVIEKLAKESNFSEFEVAKLALQLAQFPEETSPNEIRSNQTEANAALDEVRRHVGYYLIDDGLFLLSNLLLSPKVFKLPLLMKVISEKFRKWSVHFYIFTILALSTLTVFGILNFLQVDYCFVPILLVTSAEFAVKLLNWVVAKSIPPVLLPRLSFETGIPEEFKTVVVVHALLSSVAQIRFLVADLEIRFLGNQDQHLKFVLLTDFEDASEQNTESDSPLFNFLKRRVEKLNVKYGKNESKFYVLHRLRSFVPAEKIWRGYERKRGKLCAFADFLVFGCCQNEFALHIGNVHELEDVKFVITLDRDTTLPIGTARKLVGILAHPLNAPVLDSTEQSLLRGYGILQPQICLRRPSSTASWYTRIYSAAKYAGLDPYTLGTSNFYQDAFGQGSYVGKGIFDVCTFQKVLYQKYPENRILSHDLLEGCHLRTAYVSDVELAEDVPSCFQDDLSRRHRWIRGDWQNVSYLWPMVTNGSGQIVPNSLSLLSKWKIFDNLRRSLLPVTNFLILSALLAWANFQVPKKSILENNLQIATLTVLVFSYTFEFCIQMALMVGSLRWEDLKSLAMEITDSVLIFVFKIVVLPIEAMWSIDAIFRVGWRVNIFRKKLLDWTEFAASTSSTSLVATVSIAWPAPFILLVTMTTINFTIQTQPILDMYVIVISGLWCVSPLIIFWSSRVSQPKKLYSSFSTSQVRFLRQLSRKTWEYFETFWTKEDNFLIPDNFHVSSNTVAHRTSPTNIGLALLANLSAYDFGYISSGNLLHRTSQTVETLFKLETSSGHLYNWYDTVTLKRIFVHYVSSVDSGNFLACLVSLRQGLLSISKEKVVSDRVFEGLLDTFSMAIDGEDLSTNTKFLFIERLLQLGIDGKTKNLAQIWKILKLVKTATVAIRVCYLNSNIPKNEAFGKESEIDAFSKFERHLADVCSDLLLLAPWLELGPPTSKKFDNVFDTFSENVSLKEFYASTAGWLLKICSTKFHSFEAETLWFQELELSILAGKNEAGRRLASFKKIAASLETLIERMDFNFLYHPDRKLLRIGYNHELGKGDEICYDMLASEARLGAFTAISGGKIPVGSWMKLGRHVIKGVQLPISYTGSMFEYLMPQLILPTYEHGCLSSGNLETVVRFQMAFAASQNIPWGFSESACGEDSQYFDYTPNGVPALSLDGNPCRSLVVAPYAAALALMVLPVDATNNLQKLQDAGYDGKFGLYEAGEWTSCNNDQCKGIIHLYMAHHQAMSFLSMATVLLGDRNQKRFCRDKRVKSALYLIQ